MRVLSGVTYSVSWKKDAEPYGLCIGGPRLYGGLYNGVRHTSNGTINQRNLLNDLNDAARIDLDRRCT